MCKGKCTWEKILNIFFPASIRKGTEGRGKLFAITEPLLHPEQKMGIKEGSQLSNPSCRLINHLVINCCS